ncbi:MAG: aminopeptidase P family protein [Rhodobacteraceae bacterium]|jgi:Xaa-Pro aminopeptidase|nr:aminopeptidase P family protein [Paracoccaceae bacterium]
MAEPLPPLDLAEFARRLAALQGGMSRARLDALLLTAPADIAWISGLRTRFWQSPCRAWHVAVPQVGAPVAVIPDIGAAPMRQSWVTDIRSFPAPGADGVAELAATLGAMAPETGAIGLPMGPGTALHMPLAAYRRLTEAVAPRRLVDAGALVSDARAVKSAAETARIRAAARAAGAAFARLPRLAAPGRTVAETGRAVEAAALMAGADWVGYCAAVAGPGGYPDVIAPGGDAPLAPGDVLIVDLGVVVEGYFCDFARNLAIGPPSAAARDGHAALHGAVAAGLAAARPGATAADLHAAMAAALHAAGHRPAGGRFGHGIGLSLTEPPSLMPGDRTVLREGMVLALEPAIELGPGRFMVAEENVVLRESGAVLLTDPADASLMVAG